MKQKKEKKKKKEMRGKKINDWLINDIIIGEIRALLKQQEEKHYYKPKRVRNLWSNNYIKYESNCYKNRNLSLDEYLNIIETYLWNIITDLENQDTWTIQLINLISR